MFVIDPEWQITDMNEAAGKLLGRDPTTLIGQGLWDEYPDALTSEFGRQYREAMTTREPTSFEAFYAPLDSWFDVRVFPRADGGLTIHFASVALLHAARAERERLLDAEREARLLAEATHQRLAFAADHDQLTGLANRTAALRWLDDARRLGRVVVFLCDLTDFRRVNDSMGHSCGDDVLRQVATRLKDLVRPLDLVARVGGNEFILAVAGDPRPGLADAILDIVRDPLEVAGRRLVTTASVGIADTAVGVATSADGLLREADLALYRAKERGPDRAVAYDVQLHEQFVDRLAVEADLRTALERDELHLVYQPAFDLQTGRAVGCEALSRWDHPTRGPVPPTAFIPVAEATGLIIPLGEWVLRTAADFVRRGTGTIGGRPFTVWANVSGRQLLDPSFLPMVERNIEGIERRIGLEVTESVLLDDPGTAAAQLERLVDVGVRVAIDDFGTGYSSLAQLTRYPIHVIKIDRSFVSRIETPQHRAIVVAVVELAHAFGARTIAEGVETPEQLHVLREIGCDEVSGFLLARPVRREDLRQAVMAGAGHLHQDRLPLGWEGPRPT